MESLNLARLISRIDTNPSYEFNEGVLWKPKIGARDKLQTTYMILKGDTYG